MNGESGWHQPMRKHTKLPMNRIRTQDNLTYKLATNAIAVLAFAGRPLLAPELVHALAVDLDFEQNAGAELLDTGDL